MRIAKLAPTAELWHNYDELAWVCAQAKNLIAERTNFLEVKVI